MALRSKKIEEEVIYHPFAEGKNLRIGKWGTKGPQVVFTPGNGFTGHTYLPALRPLLDQTQLYIVNPRGQGGSDAPDEWNSWDEAAEDLIAFIEQQLSPPVVLAGHSFGGVISLWIAAHRPDLVSGLILMDPTIPHSRKENWLPVDWDGGKLIESTLNRTFEWTDRKAAHKALHHKGPYEGWNEDAFDLFIQKGLKEATNANGEASVQLVCPPWLESRVYATRPTESLLEWLPKVKVPTMMLKGTESLYCSTKALQEIAENTPQASINTVQGGHCFPQQNPKTTGKLVAQIWALLEGQLPHRQAYFDKFR